MRACIAEVEIASADIGIGDHPAERVIFHIGAHDIGVFVDRGRLRARRDIALLQQFSEREASGIHQLLQVCVRYLLPIDIIRKPYALAIAPRIQ